MVPNQGIALHHGMPSAMFYEYSREHNSVIPPMLLQVSTNKA